MTRQHAEQGTLPSVLSKEGTLAFGSQPEWASRWGWPVHSLRGLLRVSTWSGYASREGLTVRVAPPKTYTVAAVEVRTVGVGAPLLPG